MKRLILTWRYFLYLVFGSTLIAGIFGCTKDSTIAQKGPSNDDPISVNTWIYNQMANYYYWNTQLPTVNNTELSSDPRIYFNALRYKTEDPYSYIAKGGVASRANNFSSSTDEPSQTEGYGIGLKWLLKTSIPSSEIIYTIPVMYVEPSSPAAAKITRGEVIVKINNQFIKSETDALCNKLFEKGNITLEVAILSKNTANQYELTNPRTVTLTSTTYTIHPILFSSVLSVGGHKIGYVVLKEFLENDISHADIRAVFAQFKNTPVDQLIFDLRYNPGGRLNTLRLIASLLVPEAQLGRQFFHEEYNRNFSGGTQPTFLPATSVSDCHLNLSKFYAITTSSTASSSEILIYCLKPFMEVYVVGAKTYGKNFGTTTLKHEATGWEINPVIAKVFDINHTTYTGGIVPDYTQEEGVPATWGIPATDALLSVALNRITGSNRSISVHSASPTNFTLIPLPATLNSAHSSTRGGIVHTPITFK